MNKIPLLLIAALYVSCQTPSPVPDDQKPLVPEQEADRPLPPHTVTESPFPTPAEKTGRTFEIGTNIKEIRDYSREIPFVNLMHSARIWYTKSTVSMDWNTEQVAKMTFRADGYPTHLPQSVPGRTDLQNVATIWADTSSWPQGTYTVLWDGTGTLYFGGKISNQETVNSHKLTFYLTPGDGIDESTLEMVVTSSDAGDPVRNIRVLIPGHEATYLEKPFNPLWLQGLRIFKSIRFMDWGETNSWNYNKRFSIPADQVFTWADRAQMDHYTWADGRGVPYEMMIKLMNDENFDGWICVPDRVDLDFFTQMATLFRETLNPNRHLTVEYSNEIWNSIMDQTKFLRDHGKPSPYAIQKFNSGAEGYNYDPTTTWPEKITGPMEDCLRIWTEVFTGQSKRITRVIGLQGAWKDLSRRMAFNVDPQYFDAVTQGWYFALLDAPLGKADAALDLWGSNATIDVVAQWTRFARHYNEKMTIKDMIDTIANPLGKEMLYYEGGNHMTPTPFGEKPSYAGALEAIHRSPVMYDLYMEWFAFMRTMKQGDKPIKLMNFNYIAGLSAAYGSWGMFETLGQDTSKVPAPKYEAIKEALTW